MFEVQIFFTHLEDPSSRAERIGGEREKAHKSYPNVVVSTRREKAVNWQQYYY